MRKEDELLLLADRYNAIGIQNMIVALRSDCLDSEKIVELLQEFTKYSNMHDVRMEDLAMYKEKVSQARAKYAELNSKYKTVVARNKELTDKLSTKFDNI
jgi:hypothetical protein